MRKYLVVSSLMMLIVLLSVAIKNVSGSDATATLTMKNKSPFKVALYVDNTYQCLAEPKASCTTKITPGNREMSARVDSDIVTSQKYDFQPNEIRTWTVGFTPNK